jgi:hypothetical protein
MSAPDFSERDRALLALLRPHLHQVYLGADRRPTLTPRHWELLRMVAAETWHRDPPNNGSLRDPGRLHKITKDRG